MIRAKEKVHNLSDRDNLAKIKPEIIS